MRIFGRSRVTKTSASSRTSAAIASEASSVMRVREPAATMHATDLAQTDEMPIVREISAYVAQGVATTVPDLVESTTGQRQDSEDGNSDVFVCRRSSPDLDAEAAAAAAAIAAQGVTLFVYGWESVEPGPLSWAFPSLRAALDAVRTMRNAVEWAVVSGSEWASIEAARAEGAVLVEQNA